jgi:hypothetical protein
MCWGGMVILQVETAPDVARVTTAAASVYAFLGFTEYRVKLRVSWLNSNRFKSELAI